MNFCTSCGAKVAPGILFCTSCGTPMPKMAVVEPPVVPPATPTEGDVAQANPSNTADTRTAPTGAGDAPPINLPRTQPISTPVRAARADSSASAAASRAARSRRLRILVVSLIALAVTGSAVAVVLARTRTSPIAHQEGRGPSSATSAPGGDASTPSPDDTPSSAPPSRPVSVSNLAGQASIAAPESAPNGRDSAGNPTTYGTDHLVDGDPSTAWRMIGDGAGSELTFTFDTPHLVSTVGLINGYAKRDPSSGYDRYVQERRITAVTWAFDEDTVAQQLSPTNRGLQRLALPTPVTTTTVSIHIEATTGYAQPYDFTAISEVQIDGQ